MVTALVHPWEVKWEHPLELITIVPGGCSHLISQGFTRAVTIYTTTRYPFVPVQARVHHLFVPVQVSVPPIEEK